VQLRADLVAEIKKHGMALAVAASPQKHANGDDALRVVQEWAAKHKVAPFRTDADIAAVATKDLMAIEGAMNMALHTKAPPPAAPQPESEELFGDQVA
jgi:hypothetical protein